MDETSHCHLVKCHIKINKKIKKINKVATGENELCVNLIVLTHFVNIYHQ